MLGEVQAYRLRELREQLGLSQAQLAERIGVGQRQVSNVENGNLDSACVGTVRKYMEAVGGELVVEYVAGDSRLQVARLVECMLGNVKLASPKPGIHSRWHGSS